MPAPRTQIEIRGSWCQHAFERIREFLLSPPVLVPSTPGRPLLLYLSVSNVALGCMLAQLDDSEVYQRKHGCRALSLTTSFGCQPFWIWIGVLLIFPHGDHIPRFVRLAFSDRHPATNNIVEYEACILGLETTLELGSDRWKCLLTPI
ncbi:hypothetical protein CK203_096070 [Vitis vinifera]|uniref:Reverse transcriptase/retrotransposon-derived protein RNase H-like domain-containing protein n=1 Tax=Vitis vinifera TaxID=29760 RepID=A0A438CGR5_VITVI|nr:hypothetical protein CK203_096070 [Vitis vinifera]